MSTPEELVEQLGVPDPEGDPRIQPGAEGIDREMDILHVLQAYKDEAKHARKEGPNGRDDVWEANWDLYWGRMDYSDKAEWQSQEVMPEAPQFVDRWASAMREALNQPGDFFTVHDPTDQNNDLTPHIERFINVLLTNAGRTPDGHPSQFDTVFEDLMKLGALMAMSATVTWRNGRGPGGGQVAVEPTDPRSVWVDHTGRGLYRLRSYEIDKHELDRRAQQTDASGQPIYNPDAIEDLKAMEDEDRRQEKEASTGHSQETSSPREPVMIDEWLATVVDNSGEVIVENNLIVVANERAIIRGPEPNPFWHERDWVVFAPMVTVPLSVYGRSYMEDWASVARSFIEMTNLIMDATFTSALNAYAMAPEMLEDPTQAQEGVTPNKVFTLEQGTRARDFIETIELGRLPPESIRVWEGLKQEMREGAKLSEIALGQVPPKGDITATEVQSVTQAGSSIVRSMARTTETRLLEPVLELIWQTGLQHVDFSEPQIQQELGMETARMLETRRQEFQQRHIRFEVRGISSLVARQEKLQGLMSALQTISSSEMLMREFAQKYDFGALMDELMRLFGVDTLSLQPTERERRLRAIVQQMQARQQAEQDGEEKTSGQEGSEGTPRRPREESPGPDNQQ